MYFLDVHFSTIDNGTIKHNAGINYFYTTIFDEYSYTHTARISNDVNSDIYKLIVNGDNSTRLLLTKRYVFNLLELENDLCFHPVLYRKYNLQ